MRFDDGAGDVQPQSHTGFVKSAALIPFVESVEYIGQILFRNAVALIVHADNGFCAAVLDGNDEDIRLSVDTTEEEKDTPSKVKLPDFVTGNSEYESSLRGIATHNFLQFFELRNFGVGKADSELKRLVEKEFMSKKDAERVRLNEIELFAKSKLLQKMQDAKKLYREFRFNVMLPAALFTENEEKKKAFEGREILLQGIIDCLIEDEDGNLHLVDYKTDRLTRAELADKALAQKTLSKKHKLQLPY